MKTTRTFIIVLTFACVSLLVNAQLSTNELPFSFRVENQHLFIQKNAQINSYKALLPKTVEELNTEDIVDRHYKINILQTIFLYSMLLIARKYNFIAVKF